MYSTRSEHSEGGFVSVLDHMHGVSCRHGRGEMWKLSECSCTRCGHDMATKSAESTAHVELKVGLGAKLDLIHQYTSALDHIRPEGCLRRRY